MDENSLTVVKVSAVDVDEKQKHEREIAERFTRDGDRYHYNEAPDVTAFNDHGSTISSTSDRPMIAEAMTLLAVSKGWEKYKTKGTYSFYGSVEYKSNTLKIEREPSAVNDVVVAVVTDRIDDPASRMRTIEAINEKIENRYGQLPDVREADKEHIQNRENKKGLSR